jgi:hypothetical protein
MVLAVERLVDEIGGWLMTMMIMVLFMIAMIMMHGLGDGD